METDPPINDLRVAVQRLAFALGAFAEASRDDAGARQELAANARRIALEVEMLAGAVLVGP